MQNKMLEASVEKSVSDINTSEKLEALFKDYQGLPEYADIPINDITTISSFGDRPIHIACTRGSLDDLLLLIDGGADVNAKGEHGYTPAHQAVEQGHLVILEALVSKGADLTLLNDEGVSPKGLAGLLKEDEILNYINGLL